MIRKIRPFIIFYIIGMITYASANSDILTNERRSYVRSHPQLDEHTRLLILNGYIELGMPQEQIIASIGLPIKKVVKRGKDFDEIWTYRPHWKFRNHLYFSNKILVSTIPDYLVYSRLEGHGYRGFDVLE